MAALAATIHTADQVEAVLKGEVQFTGHVKK